MKLFPRTTLSAALATALLAPTLAQAGGNDITVIFTRHAEKETTVTVTGPADSAYDIDYDVSDDAFTVEGETRGDALAEVCRDDKCAEELNAKGLLRADLLVSYFDKKGILDDITAVYSSHKYRTYQTVLPTAIAIGEEVVQLPMDATELDPQGTSKSECPTLGAILSANAGDTLLVAGHSGTLYDIMGSGVKGCEFGTGLGLDTDDADAFPKDEEGKVRDFGDLWTVVIKRGEAKLKERVNLQPVELRVVSKAK